MGKTGSSRKASPDEVVRQFLHDPSSPVLFCDVMRAAVLDEGILLTLYQTNVDLTGKSAVSRPITTVMLTWGHVKRTAEFLNGFLEKWEARNVTLKEKSE